MNVRPAAALATALLALAAAQASAAGRSCLLLTDPAGDATTAGALPHRDSLDIRSADVATGKRTLVVVLRLGSVDGDPTLRPGVTYQVRWRAGTYEQAVLLHRYAHGEEVGVFDPDTTATSLETAQVAVKVHPPTNTITWTVPRVLNPALGRKPVRFSGFGADADPEVNVATPSATPFRASTHVHLVAGDTAMSGKTYVDRAPSCVKAT